jgi:hypothetical protein
MRVARLSARTARQRREAIHVWSSSIVRQASDITIIAPPIKDSTKSGHGNQEDPGAAVDLVAETNRHILGYAPAMAIQMLEYKAAEAGIRCDVIRKNLTDHHDVARVVKTTRQARKAIKRS